MKDVISKRRKELGLTQQQLADKLFISDKVISKWETGKSIPDTAILVDLANALDLSLDELLNVKDMEQKNNNVSLAEIVKNKYKNISIITLSLQLISAIIFWISIGIYEEVSQSESDMMMVLFVMMILIPIILFISSVTYYLVSTNKIKSKYARFIKLDNFYFNLFIILSAVFITIDTLCIIYYNSINGNSEMPVSSIIAIGTIAIIVGTIILIKHLIFKYKK